MTEIIIAIVTLAAAFVVYGAAVRLLRECTETVTIWEIGYSA